jgi:5-deoxy-D-glucuronate isomerase
VRLDPATAGWRYLSFAVLELAAGDSRSAGAGNASRQINHIVQAPGFPADRLLLVEVITPSGNWSSWPPHKHDVDDMPREAVLEEVYCYQFRRPEAWAIQRLYRRPGTPAAARRDRAMRCSRCDTARSSS